MSDLPDDYWDRMDAVYDTEYGPLTGWDMRVICMQVIETWMLGRVLSSHMGPDQIAFGLRMVRDGTWSSKMLKDYCKSLRNHWLCYTTELGYLPKAWFDPEHGPESRPQ